MSHIATIQRTMLALHATTGRPADTIALWSLAPNLSAWRITPHDRAAPLLLIDPDHWEQIAREIGLTTRGSSEHITLTELLGMRVIDLDTATGEEADTLRRQIQRAIADAFAEIGRRDL